MERGCAQQSYQHQALVRGKWRTVTTVLEEVSHCPSSSSYFPHFPTLLLVIFIIIHLILKVYTSGCMTDREWAGPLSSDTEYCYCKEDKCNNSQTQVMLIRLNSSVRQFNQSPGRRLQHSWSSKWNRLQLHWNFIRIILRTWIPSSSKKHSSVLQHYEIRMPQVKSNIEPSSHAFSYLWTNPSVTQITSW